MNNLIMSLLAVGFAAVLVFAGASYLQSGTATRVTVATNSVADIEQMMSDYQSLRFNLGRRPTASDYNTVYAGQSTNSSYSTGSAYPVRPASLMGAVPLDPSVPTTGWTYSAGCGGTSTTSDCFYLQIDPSKPNATAGSLAYQAAMLAAKREASGSNASQIELYTNGAVCTAAGGCTGSGITNPAGWPTTAPGSPYYLAVSMTTATAASTTGPGNTIVYASGCSCTYGDTTYQCGDQWTAITAVSQACPNGETGTETGTASTPYICAGDNNPQQNGTPTYSYPNGTNSCAGCSATTVQTCTDGNPGSPGTNSDTNSVSWICTSVDGTATALCPLTCGGNTVATNGYCVPSITCGTAANTPSNYAPTANLCSDGSTPTVGVSNMGTSGATWSWTCGSNACAAPITTPTMYASCYTANYANSDASTVQMTGTTTCYSGQQEITPQGKIGGGNYGWGTGTTLSTISLPLTGNPSVSLYVLPNNTGTRFTDSVAMAMPPLNLPPYESTMGPAIQDTVTDTYTGAQQTFNYVFIYCNYDYANKVCLGYNDYY
jgi:hypothetical protein